MYQAAGMSDDDESDYEGFTMGSSPPKENFIPLPVDPREKILNDIYRGVKDSDLYAIQQALNNDFQITLESPLQGNWTALMHACSDVNLLVVKFLLGLGCSVNTHIALFTPLMAACSTSNKSEENVLILIKFLIENKANVNVSDAHGTTPLMLACQVGYPSVVSELLKHKARVNDEDNQGRTALYWAINENHYKICSLLIEKNCTINLQDERGLTPMQLASIKGYSDILELLECCEGGRKLNPYYSEVKELIARNSWRDCVPGPDWCGMEEPPYYADVDTILHGMEMEHLVPDILHHKITLKEFLQIANEKLLNLGVSLPFERRVILNHLELFHVKRWNKNSISKPTPGSSFSIFNFLMQISSHYKHILSVCTTINALNNNFEIHGQSHQKQIIRKEMERAYHTMKISANDFLQEIRHSKYVLKNVKNLTEKPVDFVGGRDIDYKSRYNLCKFTLIFTAASLVIGFAMKRFK